MQSLRIPSECTWYWSDLHYLLFLFISIKQNSSEQRLMKIISKVIICRDSFLLLVFEALIMYVYGWVRAIFIKAHTHKFSFLTLGTNLKWKGWMLASWVKLLFHSFYSKEKDKNQLKELLNYFLIQDRSESQTTTNPSDLGILTEIKSIHIPL